MTDTTELRDTILAVIINDTRTPEHRSEYLDLLHLRGRLAAMEGFDPTRDEVDAALLDLHLSGAATLIPEEGFRFLATHPEYGEAGVKVGGETRHLIKLDS